MVWIAPSGEPAVPCCLEKSPAIVGALFGWSRGSAMSLFRADLAGNGSGRHRRVWRLAAPIILSGLSVPLQGAVDTAVVGRLPDAAYIGGVALGAMIFNFLYWGFGFLRMATTGFTAQAQGASDGQEIGAALDRSLILALA